MTALIAELYIAAVAAAGVVIGFYLHLRLRVGNELAVKSPSPFKNRAHRAVWIEEEAGMPA
jgi:hypothetical protein